VQPTTEKSNLLLFYSDSFRMHIFTDNAEMKDKDLLCQHLKLSAPLSNSQILVKKGQLIQVSFKRHHQDKITAYVSFIPGVQIRLIIYSHRLVTTTLLYVLCTVECEILDGHHPQYVLKVKNINRDDSLQLDSVFLPNFARQVVHSVIPRTFNSYTMQRLKPYLAIMGEYHSMDISMYTDKSKW
jgi:hypothetical protein